MNTTKIFTKAIFVVSILLSALLIGCNDMIEPMAQVELTVRMDDHNIPLTSSFTLYGTKQGSRATIQKEPLSVPGTTSTNSIKSGAVGHSECDLTIAGTG